MQFANWVIFTISNIPKQQTPFFIVSWETELELTKGQILIKGERA